jgi:hypothetical protein
MPLTAKPADWVLVQEPGAWWKQGPGQTRKRVRSVVIETTIVLISSVWTAEWVKWTLLAPQHTEVNRIGLPLGTDESLRGAVSGRQPDTVREHGRRAGTLETQRKSRAVLCLMRSEPFGRYVLRKPGPGP